MDLFRLDGRRALVTGSTRGIGLAIARGLADAGARVVIHGRSDESLARVVSALAEDGIAVESVAFDVADADAAALAVDELERTAPIDILVHNAGLQHRKPLTEFSATEWDRVIRADLSSGFYVGVAVARHMIGRGRGKIITTCSVQSAVARPSIGPYIAAKSGLAGLTRAMCAEWGPHGIQANGIGPGYIATAMTDALTGDEAFASWLSDRVPAGRWGRPEDLVGAAVFLASAASDFVNGQVLYVDGGLLAVV